MIFYKTDEEIELIRQSCLLVCKVLTHVGSVLKPGISGKEIDDAAEDLIRDHNAKPAFKGYKGTFPTTLCVSKNNVVVHGIPDEKMTFEDGDVVSVDCGVLMNGFFGDAAYTFAIGDVSEDIMKLLRATNESLYKAIEQAIVGRRLGDIGFAVQNHIEKVNHYKVVKDLVGHGIGRELHEEPQVMNYGKRGRGIKLKEGLVMAIEPMVNMKRREVFQGNDGWSIFTKDKLPSAHYEHTVAVRKDKADVLSDHTGVEEAIRNNSNLKEIGVYQPQELEV